MICKPCQAGDHSNHRPELADACVGCACERTQPCGCPVGQSGCWVWQATRPKDNGYCRITWGGSRQYAHRVAYQMANGPIPDGLVVDHMCFVRACVNPDHLRLLTAPENSSRCQSKIAEFCLSGKHAKIPENLVAKGAAGRPQCIPCMKESKVAWSEANRERTRKYSRAPRVPIQPGDGDPRHGSPSGYSSHRCRCELCRAGWLIYQREWRARRAS